MNTMNQTEKSNQWATPARACLTPAVDIFEGKDAYVLQAEMPGVNKTGLEVLLEGSQLTIVGRREEAQHDWQVLYKESKPCDFRRVFELDPAIDTGKIQAQIEQGLLTICLPKAEIVKPRRIEVTE